MDNKIKTAILYTLIVVFGVISALFLYFYQNFYRSEYYLPGVYIASLPVQGQTIEQSRAELADAISIYFDTPIEFFHGDYCYETKLKAICNMPKIDEIVEDVWQQEQERGLYSKILNLDGSQYIKYPIKLEYNPSAVERMVKFWQDNLACTYVNARVEFDSQKGLVIVPGSPGKKIDVDKTLESLPKEVKLGEMYKEIRLPIIIQEKPPAITVKDLQNIGELSSYTTWYNTAEVDRSHNVKKAADSINGTMIAPGETFSFNNVVGKRTYENGYKDAIVIVGGLFEKGIGGGICQVSSTLYNAVLLAGMDIVERYNHALAVAYVPLGRDASVAYGLQDFKFINNTDFPIYIRAVAQAGKLTVKIYGDINYKHNIEVTNIVDKVIDFNEITKLDENLPSGTKKIEINGIPGYVVRTFRIYYDANGHKLRTEKLATDWYRPLNKIILAGPEQVAPTDTEKLPNNNGDSPNLDSIPLDSTDQVPIDKPADIEPNL